jgi:hypothetical protein
MIEFKTLLTEIGNTTNGYDFEFVSSISDMYRYEFTTKNDLDYTVLFEPISSGEYLKKVYIDFNPALMDIIEDNEDDVYEVTFNVDDLFRKDT